MRIDSDWRRITAVMTCAWIALALTAPVAATTNGTVVLTSASIAASGIVVAPLRAATQTPEVQGIATVLDLQPLLTLAGQSQALQAKAQAAAVLAKAAEAQAKRSHTLYQQGTNASLRDVQTADAAAATAKAQQQAASAAVAVIHRVARVQWGAALAARVAQGPQALDDYAHGRANLLSVVLPADAVAPVGTSIRVMTLDRHSATATLLGPSPRTDAVVQGPTFFYRVNGAYLRSGQRLTATVPQGTATRRGVIVPNAAVIWYAGQPWAYLETTPGHFQRHPLTRDVDQAKDWFQMSGFRPGERVVVRGGELLLSQELQPPSGTQAAGDDDD